jgi:hypothetical protein
MVIVFIMMRINHSTVGSGQRVYTYIGLLIIMILLALLYDIRFKENLKLIMKSTNVN